MKKQLLIIVLLILSTSSFAQFRNTTWGMSKEQVKKIEKEKLVNDYGNKVKYDFLVEDFKVELSYLFNNDDQLQTIVYIFSPPVKRTFISNGKYPIWDKTVRNIIAKYGEPTSKPSDKVFNWDLKDFSIKAVKGAIYDTEHTEVIYTPPAPSLKDIL